MRAELQTQALAAVAGYAGGEGGAAGLAPALRVLRAAWREGRLVLLWPAGVSVPPLVAAAVDTLIEYRPPGRWSGECLNALAREDAAAAVIFTEPGHAPDLPAYLSYLAGIETRAALAGEFSGSVLSLPVEAPDLPLPAEERHLHLLDRVLAA